MTEWYESQKGIRARTQEREVSVDWGITDVSDLVLNLMLKMSKKGINQMEECLIWKL